MLDEKIQTATDEKIVSWVDRYVASRLALKRETTRITYTLILRQFLTWLSYQPGHDSSFDSPPNLTQTAVQTYLFGELAETALVRPNKSIFGLEVSSVHKKMKSKGFAAGVNRDDLVNGATELGIDLDEHIASVIQAMSSVADILGLAGVGARFIAPA